MRGESRKLLYLENRGVDDLVKKQSLKESVCELRVCHEQSSRLVGMRNHECLLQCQQVGDGLPNIVGWRIWG